MNPRHPREMLWIPLVAVLAACAGPSVKPPQAGTRVCDAVSPGAQCTALIASLAGRASAPPPWSMQGRVAISTGTQGGNARIEWRQRAGDAYGVTLAAPVTRQSWRLDVLAGQASLSGLEGGPRRGADAAVLLREATGWDIPVASMRHWLRGQPADGIAPTRYVFSPNGALVGLDQAGWRIDFERAGAAALPMRMAATRGDSRVRLVVDRWDAGTGE